MWPADGAGFHDDPSRLRRQVRARAHASARPDRADGAGGGRWRSGWGGWRSGFWRLRRYRRHATAFRTADVRLRRRPAALRRRREPGDVRLPQARWCCCRRGFRNSTGACRKPSCATRCCTWSARDWLFTVVEELVRAVFWFHPAIWWLLGEIQLAREQAVDREVVEHHARRATSTWMRCWPSPARGRCSTWRRRRCFCASGT